MKEWIIYAIKSGIKQLLKVFQVVPIKRNRIFFWAYSGKQYACNPKYIYEELLAKYPDKFEVIWMINRPIPIPGNPICVKRNSFKYCYYILTSHVIVSNGGFNVFLPYKKSQLKINTWHGGGAYKKGGLDTECSDIERRRLKIDGANTDLLISSNKRFSKVFPPSCAIDPNRVWEIGLPRNDLLLHAKSSDRKTVFEKLKLDFNKKLVLFAPTYRGDFSHATFKDITFDYKKCKEALSKRFGGSWLLGFRMHYAYASEIREVPDSINLSDYPDMQELLLAADILITDYSSSIWDFSLTNRPCFIWATDLDQYKRDVDFYTPIEEWPFSIAKTDEELVSNILNFDEQDYLKAVAEHHSDLGDCETGHASEIVANAIYNYCFNNVSKADITSCK